MRLFIFFVLMLFLLMTSVEAGSGKQQLNQFMQKVVTLDTGFTQEVISEDGDIVQSSHGRFMLSRPGKFRWEYEGATAQEIISDGVSLWIYDKELAQATVKPLDDVIGASPAAILTRQRDINKDYKVIEKSSSEGLNWVELTPLDDNGDFKRILIGLDQKGIQAMNLHDQFGQTTTIRFRMPVFNTSINQENFKFSPPAGVDVIGQPAS